MELSTIQDTVAQTESTVHKYSTTLTTLEGKVDALIVPASKLDLCARDSSEQKHTKGFRTLMDRLRALMGSAHTVKDSTADGTESNTDQSTGEPEELEQEEELQDDERSNCLSQSSPSSLSLELDPLHCHPSMLNFIVPLVELFRAELSTIQDMVTQMGSTEHKCSDTLATLEDEVDMLIVLACELDLHARDSSEQEHAVGFGALIDHLGMLMTSACAVKDSAEDNAEPDDTPVDSAGTAANEEEEHNHGCSSSSTGKEGELSALSWEEIPSSMYIPPIHYSLSCPRPRTIPSDISTSFLLLSVDSPPPSIPLDDSSAPICLYSPHTHTYTNPKPRTAFFSVGRRLRVVRNPAHPQWKPLPPRT